MPLSYLKYLRSLGLQIALLTILALSVFGQVSTGRISGTITDAAGATLPG